MPDGSRPPRRRQAALRLVVALGVVALGAVGCAGVPDSGRVHLARELPAVDDPDPLVHGQPAGPTIGMTPHALVAGFLEAVVDSDSGYAVAKQFLVSGTPWNPRSGGMVYDGEPVIHRDGVGEVSVTLRRTGDIDSRGSYHVDSYRVDPGTVTLHYNIQRVNGQWRISGLPSGVPLSDSVPPRSLQPAAVYFFNRAQTRLVPEPILVPPDQPSLATTLMHALLTGPSPALAPAVTTAAPTGVALVDNVTVDANGVAEVDLSPSAQQIPASQLARLSAQIVWTLRQVGAVKAVRLVDSSKPLTAAGVPPTQRVGAWSQFAPQAPPVTAGALAVRDGHVVGIGMTVPASLRSRSLAAPAESDDGLSVAVLRRKRGTTTLLVGSTFGPLQAPFASSSFTPPVFDPAGDIFTVRGEAPRSTLTELTITHTIRTVVLPASLRHRSISGLAISGDGSRIAMVVGAAGHAAVEVGVIAEEHGGLVIRSVQLVVPGAEAASGIAWAGGNEIVTTVRLSPTSRAVLTTSVDGYDTTLEPTTGLPAMPTQVAASPGEALLAGAHGRVWSLSAGRWSPVATGVDPTYPD